MDRPDGRARLGAVILVSNNPYRLRAIGAGTRPRLDEGELGVAVFEGAREREAGDEGRGLVRQWATPDFEVRSGGPVPGASTGGRGPPGTAALHSRPGALAVRIPPTHPGASPSAGPAGLPVTPRPG